MCDNNTILCNFCGEKIQRKFKACPFCGSDEKTGWSDETYLDGIDVGDTFDYNETLENEFPSEEKKNRPFFTWKSITVTIILLLSIILFIAHLL